MLSRFARGKDVLELAGICLCAVLCGGLVNAVRPTPLALWYSPPAARVAEAARQEGRVEIRLISLAEFQQAAAQGGVVVVDARPALFYEFAHIPGAVSLSKDDFDQQYAGMEAQLRSDAAQNGVIIYCSGGDCEDSAY